MSDYSKTTNFTAKDSLPTGNPSKTILGSEHDTEYSNIQTAIATKANKTGAPATTNNLAMLSATGDLADSLIETDGSGNISSNGSATFSTLTLGGTLITSSATEINYNDITALGTVEASKTVTADANGNVTFDTSSTQKKLIFDDVSGGLYESWIYGSPTTGVVGIYDFTNAVDVFAYTPSTNTIVMVPAITASGGVVGNASTATIFSTSRYSGHYLKLSHTVASGTVGGTATTGSWQTVVLNTEDNDTGSISTLSSNQFTLPAGTYRINARKNFGANTGNKKISLYNVTDTAYTIIGDAGGGSSSLLATLLGEFTIAGAKTFEIRYWVQSTASTSDLGAPASFSGVSEIYAVVDIEQVA